MSAIQDDKSALAASFFLRLIPLQGQTIRIRKEGKPPVRVFIDSNGLDRDAL